MNFSNIYLQPYSTPIHTKNTHLKLSTNSISPLHQHGVLETGVHGGQLEQAAVAAEPAQHAAPVRGCCYGLDLTDQRRGRVDIHAALQVWQPVDSE